MRRHADIAIAGCGPSGALLAMRLARAGYRVVCVSAAPQRGRIEGLGQRTIEVLRANGFERALASIGPQVPRHAIWAGEASDYNHEHVVSRAALDQALADDVANAGVEVISGRCRRGAQGEPLRIETASGESLEVAARFVVEARGRAAPRAEERTRGPETTALIRRLQRVGPPATMIESFTSGWAWYVCDGDKALLQVFIDSSAGLPARNGLGEYFVSLSGQLPGIAARVAGLESSGPVMSRNVTTTLCAEPISADSLRLGDAAAAIDPLSGHGVFAALGSALAASAAIRTLLETPQNAEAAIRFYRERTVLGALRNARMGRDFYRLEMTERPGAFWQARGCWPDDVPAHGDPSHDGLAVCDMPVVKNGLVEMAQVVVTPEHSRGVWRVADVELVRLMTALEEAGGKESRDFIEAQAQVQKVSPGQVLSALQWLRGVMH